MMAVVLQEQLISLRVADMLSLLSLMFGSGVLVWVFRLVAKLSMMETNINNIRRDIDIIHSFLFNRAKTELVHAGMARINSPLRLTVNCAEAVMPFLGKFIPFYGKLLKKYPDLKGDALDRMLFLEFEKEFGDFIVEKICIPMGVNQGACLLAIIKSCQQIQVDELPAPTGVDPRVIDEIKARAPKKDDH